MGDESSEQEGFSDIMSEEGEKKPRGKKKVKFTEEEEEDAVDEDEEYGDEEEGEGEMEEDGEEGMEDEDEENEEDVLDD